MVEHNGREALPGLRRRWGWGCLGLHRWGRRSRVIPCETAPWSVPGAGRAAAASERSAGRRRGRGRAGRGLPQPGVVVVAAGGGVPALPPAAAEPRRLGNPAPKGNERCRRALGPGRASGPVPIPPPGLPRGPAGKDGGRPSTTTTPAAAPAPRGGLPRGPAPRGPPGRAGSAAALSPAVKGSPLPPSASGLAAHPGGGEPPQLPRQGCCPPAASQQRTGEQDALSAQTFHSLRKCGPAARLLGKPRARDAVPAARAEARSKASDAAVLAVEILNQDK
ncbi:uncharacterized protein ACIBXB_007493 isoform 2-T2 [Morphnus guianensis]